jgi:hypothetical protein
VVNVIDKTLRPIETDFLVPAHILVSRHNTRGGQRRMEMTMKAVVNMCVVGMLALVATAEALWRQAGR